MTFRSCDLLSPQSQLLVISTAPLLSVRPLGEVPTRVGDTLSDLDSFIGVRGAVLRHPKLSPAKRSVQKKQLWKVFSNAHSVKLLLRERPGLGKSA